MIVVISNGDTDNIRTLVGGKGYASVRQEAEFVEDG